MLYPDARRAARSLLGSSADIEERKGAFPCRVGVWVKVARGHDRFIIVAAANTWEEALKEARERQS